MIWKKTCKKCRKKSGKEFTYCPYCGSHFNENKNEKEEYGFLGKEDNINPFDNMKLPFGFNAIFKKLVKEMDKQFREIDREIGEEKTMKKTKENPFVKQGGISINISSMSGKDMPVIKVRGFGNVPEFKGIEKNLKPIKIERKNKEIKISEEKAKKIAKLPRQEAESKVRRFGGKVVYEIEVPGVKSLEDVIINRLENSIEIKAFAEDKAFFKLIPITLPLLRYGLSKSKMTLEFGDKS